MNYAKALRIVRAARGISQQELAGNAGLSKSLVSKIESGSREISKVTQSKLAKTLGVPVALLDILAMEPHDTKIPKAELESLGKQLLAIQDEITTYEKKV